MAIISTIGVSVTARTDKFRKGMKSAQATLSSFAGTAAKFAIGAGAAVAGGLTLMVKKASASIDVISKLSDRIGIATEDIVALQFAARITGVSMETMNKSLEQMTRRLGEASFGTGEAIDALKLLGLSAQNMIRISPAEAFSKIADAINGLGTQAEKAQVAYDLFGRSGIQLLNTLAVGSEGMNKFALAAKRIGLTFTNLEGKQVADMIDAVGTLQKTFTGLAIAFTIKVAPSIRNVADNMTEFMVTLRQAGATILPVVAITIKFTAALGAAVVTIAAINLAMGAWNKLTRLQIGLQTVLKFITSPAGALQVVAGLAAAGGTLIAINKLFKSMGEEAGEAATQTKDLRTEMDELAATRDRKFGGRFGLRSRRQFLGVTPGQQQELARMSRPTNTLRNEELQELREMKNLLREMVQHGGLAA